MKKGFIAGFTGDPTHPQTVNGQVRYYGYLVYAGATKVRPIQIIMSLAGKSVSRFSLPVIFIGLAACGGGSTSPNPTPTPTTGSVQLNVVTVGADPDPDGYTATLASQAKQVSVNGSVTFPDIAAGTQTVALTGLAGNCSASALNPTSVTVTGGSTQQVSMSVLCLVLVNRRPGQILFTSGRANPQSVLFSEVYVMTPDGRGETRLTSNGKRNSSPIFSPDGSRIAFGSGDYDGDSEIYAMNANGTAAIDLTNNPAADNYPAWPPDGRRIAFCSDRSAPRTGLRLYVMNADGTGVVQLSTGIAVGESWSADGQKIAFLSFSAGTGSQIHVINVDGSGEITLAVGQDPSWSPDGTEIAFDNAGVMKIMNADGTGLVTLSKPGNDYGPVWSPDGLSLVFNRCTSSSSRDCDLFVMNADGTGQTQITQNHREGFQSWGPPKP